MRQLRVMVLMMMSCELCIWNAVDLTMYVDTECAASVFD